MQAHRVPVDPSGRAGDPIGGAKDVPATLIHELAHVLAGIVADTGRCFGVPTSTPQGSRSATARPSGCSRLRRPRSPAWPTSLAGPAAAASHACFWILLGLCLRPQNWGLMPGFPALLRRRQNRRNQTQAEADAYEQQQQMAMMQPSPQDAPPAPVAAPTMSVVEQLTQLAALKEQGVVTEAEFEMEKSKILAG